MTQLATVLPASQARANFYDLLEASAKNLRTFFITHRGKPKVAIIPMDELESWQETLEVIAENPNIVNELTKSREEVKKGKTISIDKLIKKHNL